MDTWRGNYSHFSPVCRYISSIYFFDFDDYDMPKMKSQYSVSQQTRILCISPILGTCGVTSINSKHMQMFLEPLTGLPVWLSGRPDDWTGDDI